MRWIFPLLLLFTSISVAQDLKLIKAVKQMTNSGASPTSTINYTVQVSKSRKCKVSIDSVVNVYTQKATPFHITKHQEASVLSPSKQVNASEVKDKGSYEIHFSATKQRGSGRPGAPPMNLTVPLADFTQGAVIYYRVGKMKKKLIVESFEELETVNAP